MTTELPLPELERLHFLINCISQAAKDRGRDWQSMVIDISEAVETADKVRAEVAAAIAADRAQRVGWLSIEQAPKDGTHVLAIWPRRLLDDEDFPSGAIVGQAMAVTFFSGGYWVEPDYLDAIGASFGDDDAYAPEPTHWIPLPPAPTQTPPQEAENRPSREWYAAKIHETLDDDFSIGPALAKPPAPTFRHIKSGGLYELVAHALRESDLAPMVVYRSLAADDGRVWVRPSAEFYDGRFEPAVAQEAAR